MSHKLGNFGDVNYAGFCSDSHHYNSYTIYYAQNLYIIISIVSYKSKTENFICMHALYTCIH